MFMFQKHVTSCGCENHFLYMNSPLDLSADVHIILFIPLFGSDALKPPTHEHGICPQVYCRGVDNSNSPANQFLHQRCSSVHLCLVCFSSEWGLIQAYV